MSASHDTAGRAGAMADRLRRAAARRDWTAADLGRLDAAFALAMQPRLLALDPDDPRFLHPGRTSLILLEDAAVREPEVILAGCLTESFDLELAAEPARIRDQLGHAVASLTEGVPRPAEAGPALTEALLCADLAVRLIALAERLDHARHLHLRPRTLWEAAHGITCASYVGVARHTDPTLLRRLRWWCGMFQRRYL